MSSQVKELLSSIPVSIGELYERIEILGENKKNGEEDFLDVNSRNYKRVDEFGEKNVIFGVNIILKENGTRIEFLREHEEWVPYLITDPTGTYLNKNARSRFLQITPEFKYEIDLSGITNYEGRLKRKAREILEELMDNDAVSPNGEWRKLPKGYAYGNDGYSGKLFKSGLVERVVNSEKSKHGRHKYEYRIRKVSLVKDLLTENKNNQPLSELPSIELYRRRIKERYDKEVDEAALTRAYSFMQNVWEHTAYSILMLGVKFPNDLIKARDDVIFGLYKLYSKSKILVTEKVKLAKLD
jgi:hypothetical protein